MVDFRCCNPWKLTTHAHPPHHHTPHSQLPGTTILSELCKSSPGLTRTSINTRSYSFFDVKRNALDTIRSRMILRESRYRVDLPCRSTGQEQKKKQCKSQDHRSLWQWCDIAWKTHAPNKDQPAAPLEMLHIHRNSNHLLLQEQSWANNSTRR